MLILHKIFLTDVNVIFSGLQFGDVQDSPS
jgi:hypothetical protein